jgi:hypothetical protein
MAAANNIIQIPFETVIQGDFLLRQPPFGDLMIAYNNNEVLFTLPNGREGRVPLLPVGGGGGGGFPALGGGGGGRGGGGGGLGRGGGGMGREFAFELSRG